MNVCYNPGNQRTGIDRVEIVRITPQRKPGEALTSLIQDPWRVIRNQARDARGRPSARFSATFSDPEFRTMGRDALYYVRVIQTPTPAVNGTPGINARGQSEFCPTDGDAQCTSMNEERAWTSPIYLTYVR